MKELFRRLFVYPRLATEIIVASFFVNLLSLASPIFVIQILSRYIAYGFDGTLYTLTMGMFIAIALAYGFKVVRTQLASAVNTMPDRDLSMQTLDVLSRVRYSVLGRLPQARVQEIMSGPQVLQAAYSAQSICAVLDMPFYLLFLLAIGLLSPLLAVLTLAATLATMLSSWLDIRRTSSSTKALQEQGISHRSLVTSAVAGSETVRTFSAGRYLKTLWDKQIHELAQIKDQLVDRKSRAQATLMSIASLMRVLVYAVGAKEAVMGDLTVGALIGISILSTKALQIASVFMTTLAQMDRASETTAMLREFLRTPLEPVSGTALNRYAGKLELRDLGFAYPGSTGPLFESVNIVLAPGQAVALSGFNGSGKTTFVRLLAGLLEPSRGAILVDGVDQRQIAPEWWRRQIMYLPQEPTFLNATLRDNITLGNPEIDNESLNEVIRQADLRSFLDTSISGLETEITDGGRSLPLGIRKRLALARALATDGPVAIFDEPTEGLDADGCNALYGVLNTFAKRKKTIIVVSRDVNILKGVRMVLDLSHKPIPKVLTVTMNPPEEGGAAAQSNAAKAPQAPVGNGAQASTMAQATMTPPAERPTPKARPAAKKEDADEQ